MRLEVRVTNTGGLAGDEVVQLYVTDIEASVPVPLRSMQGFDIELPSYISALLDKFRE